MARGIRSTVGPRCRGSFGRSAGRDAEEFVEARLRRCPCTGVEAGLRYRKIGVAARTGRRLNGRLDDRLDAVPLGLPSLSRLALT
ncbi:hypothetical protein ESP51_02310 [Agromyces albus]|uniref:Uncharacterized protein n=1 Tax=Agromyces albus TaxID=205332 RepID=A0A4Q2L4W1_9MICO|nr:hypothetical protein ESP51_02310 [Agromyces albus]